MNTRPISPDQSYDFLFEAASEGLELQSQITEQDRVARSAKTMTMANLQGFVGMGTESRAIDLPEDLEREVVQAAALAAAVGGLRAQLTAKEKEVDDRMAGGHFQCVC